MQLAGVGGKGNFPDAELIIKGAPPPDAAVEVNESDNKTSGQQLLRVLAICC